MVKSTQKGRQHGFAGEPIMIEANDLQKGSIKGAY
jgi:hypothetical protein